MDNKLVTDLLEELRDLRFTNTKMKNALNKFSNEKNWSEQPNEDGYNLLFWCGVTNPIELAKESLE